VNGSIVAFVATIIVLPLVLAEFGDWCPWIAVRLVRWAARRLPDPASQSRYEEEWTANLNQVPGSLARLVAAVGYLACLPAMRRSVRRRLMQSVLPADLQATQRDAVIFLARKAGLRQFLDVRIGMPATVRTHELAWMASPESRIFYAADSPAVLPPALPQPYLPGSAIDYVTADLRDPDIILMASIRTLDYSQPIAVLLRGALSRVSDHGEAQAIVHYLMRAMPSGSYLVLCDSVSILRGDPNASPDTAGTGTAHLPSWIARIFNDMESVQPSLIGSSPERWSGEKFPDAAEAGMFCAIARKA
jgi:S-adenosyl methyltransferase